MSKSRVFKKYYHRSLWLLDAEIWYHGERFGLAGITRGGVEYVTMFVYEKGKGTDVYYDITGPEDVDSKAAEYFEKYSGEAQEILEDYQKSCQQLLQFVKTKNPKDFRKLFDLHVEAWAKSASMYVFGEIIDDEYLGNAAKEARKIREDTEKFWYVSPMEVRKLARKLVPEHEQYLEVLSFDEISSENIPSEEILRKRKQGYIYFDGQVYVGINLDEFAKSKSLMILSEEGKAGTLDELKGSAAMKGKARGTARVVLDISQINNVKQGDILVASMTTPDYLGAMKKAAAFVTDEGGLLCHAAIVARELKKPCVIGTKIATQVLRDGGLVEVDANKGVIRKIKE